MRVLRAAVLTLGLLALVAAPRHAHSQSLAVYSLKGLQFGALLPGVDAAVSPVNTPGRAEVEIVGQGRIAITIELPASMSSPRGHQLPLAFGPQDGVLFLKVSSRSVTFDPRQPLEATLPAGNQQGSAAILYLGGTAKPARDQAPGEYASSVSVRIANVAT